jgi:hypothetical protein
MLLQTADSIQLRSSHGSSPALSLDVVNTERPSKRYKILSGGAADAGDADDDGLIQGGLRFPKHQGSTCY